MTLRVRNPLVRTVVDRLLEDQAERNKDHSEWYHVYTSQLEDDIYENFLQCHEDEETKKFLNTSYEKSDWIFTQIYHLWAKWLLSWFVTNTSINGLLGRGSMFVYSSKQFQDLLNIDQSWKADKLLDLGAGDGMVTSRMADHFHEVFATEISKPMQWKLQEKGYHILGLDEWYTADHQYDVITALNLLDRCDKPMTLLQQMKKKLVPDTGRIVLALVLPFRPYVEVGRADHQPTEKLYLKGHTFEEQVCSFVRDVFEPAGFVLEKFTRLPYLCEGDMAHSFYWLNDVVFVLRAS